MKSSFAFIVAVLLHLSSVAQNPKTGTYLYQYCDLEYKMCFDSCKIVIKKDSIMVYATAALARRVTNTKEGDLLELGLLLKHKTGQWIIGHSSKDATTEEIAYDISRVDLIKRQFWRY